MKKSFILFFTQSLLILLSGIEGIAVAQDDNNFGLILEPRVVTGIMGHKYEEKYYEGDNVNWEDTIPFAGIGLTLSTTLGKKNSIAVDLYAQHSAHGEDSLFKATDAAENSVLIRDYNTNLRRQDYAINFSYGKNLFTESDNVIFSIGYKVGQTDISGTRRPISVLNGQPQAPRLPFPHEETQFETQGPSAGLTYSFPIGRSRLGLNFAYAQLKSDYTNSSFTVANSATANGLAGGMIWIGPITGNLSYIFSADYYRYKTDTFFRLTAINLKPLVGSPNEFSISLDSIEENIWTIKASLNYRFDLLSF